MELRPSARANWDVYRNGMLGNRLPIPISSPMPGYVTPSTVIELVRINRSLQHLVKSLRWRVPVECHPWPPVELVGNLVEVAL